MVPLRAGGLGFRTAIAEHLRWRSRLREAIEQGQADRLDAVALCRDDRCVLGCWLHGMDAHPLRQHSLFTVLLEQHARFHRLAAEVHAHARCGRMDQALRMHVQGPYVQVSAQVAQSLARLHIASRGSVG